MSNSIFTFLVGVLLAALFCACPAQAQLSDTMRTGFADAHFVPRYDSAARAAAVQRVFALPETPRLGATISLTPNAPFADRDAHLHFWKPSFVIGAPEGGEAGVNFWGYHDGGHINVGFTPPDARSWVVDCRLISATPITYKIYSGPGAEPRAMGVRAIDRGHFLAVIQASEPGVAISVELWPTPDTALMGFLGCDLSPMN